MCSKANETFLVLKEYLTKKDCEEIKKLEEVCYSKDSINLKLELDYKSSLLRDTSDGIKHINEYFYYQTDNYQSDDCHIATHHHNNYYNTHDNNCHTSSIVSYLGICNLGHALELNGMTHPDFRRKGYFKQLFTLALEECKRKVTKTLLLLTDGKSETGISFIESVGGSYNFSEYRMKHILKNPSGGDGLPFFNRQSSIHLRKAKEEDFSDIARQNTAYFHSTEEDEMENLRKVSLTENIFIIEQDGKNIGKIHIDYNEDSAFLHGFGIREEYRGKGYGREALRQAIDKVHEKDISVIELDVESKNDRALHLYKDCGFIEQSVMRYYELNL